MCKALRALWGYIVGSYSYHVVSISGFSNTIEVILVIEVHDFYTAIPFPSFIPPAVPWLLRRHGLNSVLLHLYSVYTTYTSLYGCSAALFAMELLAQALLSLTIDTFIPRIRHLHPKNSSLHLKSPYSSW